MKSFISLLLFAAGALLIGLALYSVLGSSQTSDGAPFLRLFVMALLAGFCFQAGIYLRRNE